MLLTDRKHLMQQLNIYEHEINSKEVTEKLFCAAILNQGVDIAAKTFTEYIKLRDILHGN